MVSVFCFSKIGVGSIIFIVLTLRAYRYYCMCLLLFEVLQKYFCFSRIWRGIC